MPVDLTGVLVMAYGTPSSTQEVEAYYTDIRRGRPPTDGQLADLRRRYDAIGGLSPLTQRTRAQVKALQGALGPRFVCSLGTKHSSPSIEEGMAELIGARARVVVGLVLAPHYSALSVGQYHDRAFAAAGQVSCEMIGSWYPLTFEPLGDRVRTALATFEDPSSVELLVTAHSLPARALGLDEPTYAEQLLETAGAVARHAGAARWRVAWQSAGRTPEAWIGPDILSVIEEVAREGASGVVVCPAGFVSDHLEVLYDIDIEARRVADSVGLRLVRTPSFNDDPELISRLAAMIRDLDARE